MRVSEVNLEEIGLGDIQNICKDILSHDPKTCKKGKIKSSYAKKLGKLSKEVNDAMHTDKKVNLDKLIKKYDKFIQEICSLSPDIAIELIPRTNGKGFSIQEGKSKSILNLKMLYAAAMENDIKSIPEKKRQEREATAKKEQYDRIGKMQNSPEYERNKYNEQHAKDVVDQHNLNKYVNKKREELLNQLYTEFDGVLTPEQRYKAEEKMRNIKKQAKIDMGLDR